MNNHDYVIVGPGSPGCVLAARLPEVADNRVLLLDAGGLDTRENLFVPQTWPTLMPGFVNRPQDGRADDRAVAVIRPVGAADLPALGGFFAGLSAQTRYLRFLGPVTPTDRLLRLLSGQNAGVHALIAIVGGVIVGHAMAADRPGSGCHQDPGQEARTADIGVVVADAWQGRGAGSALMGALVCQAEARGVTSLAMDVLHVNRQVLAMILGHWPAAQIDHSRDSLDIRIALPQSQPDQASVPAASQPVRPLVAVAGSYARS